MTITGYYTTQVGLEQELGDDGVMAQRSFEGCTHPEHIERVLGCSGPVAKGSRLGLKA